MMFAIEIRFLTGRYAAGSYDDPGEAEWPPHPARVFSALTAALYEDADAPPEHRAALVWLARAGPPEVLASDAASRHLRNVYVPVNDVAALGALDRHLIALSSAIGEAAGLEGEAAQEAERRVRRLRRKVRERSVGTATADGKGVPRNAVQILEQRPRHPRRFPVALPHDDVVHLRWPEQSPPPEVRSPLDRLCARVARLGHSSSLVAMRLLEEDVEPSGRRIWSPDRDGHAFLRVPLPEQLRLLDEAFEQHRQVEPHTLPADPLPYRKTRPDGAPIARAHSHFSDRPADWIVYELVPPPFGGRRTLLDLSLAQQVARALRGSLLAHLDPDSPPSLTGHDSGRHPTSRPHLAFVPLGDVGHPHASGSILGVAMIPPRDLPPQDRDLLLEAIFRAEQSVAANLRDAEGTGIGRRLRLTLGRHGVVHLRRLTEPADRRTLTAARWCRPGRRWMSVTAVALGRNPGNLRSRDPDVLGRATLAAEATVEDACRFGGLPEPQAVWVHQRSLALGAPEARRFMPFPDQGGAPRRVCVHTEILFEEPVVGPVLLGAGRFFGIGLHLCADASFTGGGS